MPHHQDGLLVPNPNPAVTPDPAGLHKAHYTHKADTGRLFPHVPRPSDVQQGAVGDCYYLAAVLAILAKPEVAATGTTAAKKSGSEVVEEMMKDNGDNTATVRFYRKNADNSFTAQYVRVRKTFVKDTDKVGLFSHATPPRATGALWVQVLEKAWAAWINGGVLPNNYYKTIKAANGGLTNPESALECLLGALTKSKGVVTNTKTALPWGDINFTNFIGNLPSVALTQRLGDIKRDIFNNDTVLFNKWTAFLRAHFDEFIHKTEFRMEDWNAVVQTHHMDHALATHLNSYFTNNQILPGKRGTGIYTVDQISLYNKIERCLVKRKAVQVAAKQDVGTSERAGRSAGESVVKGLVGHHAFSVVAVRTDTVAPHRRWIKLRNPWNDTGRKYTAHKTQPDVLKAKETKDAEYWIELADLTKRFQSVSIGGVVG